MRVRTFAALLFVPLTIASIVICFSNGTGVGQEPRPTTESAAETSYTIWMWDQKHSPQWQPMLTVVGFGMVMQKVAALNAQKQHEGRAYTFTNGEQPLLRPDGTPLRLRVAGNPLPPGIDTSPRRIPPVVSQKIIRDKSKQKASRNRRPLKEARPAHGKVSKLYQVTHDFGIKPPNTKGKYVFTFENGGKLPLTLELTDKSCGCTSVKLNGQEMKTTFDQPLGDILQPIPMDLNELPFELPKFEEPEPVERDGRNGNDVSPIDKEFGRETEVVTEGKQESAQIDSRLPAIPEFDPVELNKLLEAAELEVEAAPEPEEHDETLINTPTESNSVAVAPGEEVRLEVDWKVGELPGPFSQSFTLTTSDPKRRKLTFHIRGQVADHFEASTDFVELGQIDVGKRTKKTFRVFSRLHDDFRLAEITSSNSAVQVRYRPVANSVGVSDEPLSEYEVTLEVSPDQPIGAVNSIITLQPVDEEFAPLIIPVGGVVRGAISIHPTGALEFPITSSGHSATQGLYLKIKTDAAVKFTRAYANPNFLKVSVKHWNDIREGSQYAIVEAVVPTDAPVGEFEGSIELQVSEPVNQRIRIPVSGRVVEQSATR